MTMEQDLPFEVGQIVESRSFSSGFRGAWFRSKIKDISSKKGHLEYQLEFIDFPDEKIHWKKAYNVRSVGKRKRNDMVKHLMMRPKYPLICHQREILDANTVHEDTVAIIGSWKVGDYVDWWTDGCYWSGKVIQILDNDKLRVDLLPPPLGEGLSYTVDGKELRPSLDWSVEFGWSVPIKEFEDSYPSARLIKPLNPAASGSHTNVGIVAQVKGVENIKHMSGQPILDTVLAPSVSGSLSIPEAVNYQMIEEAVEASGDKREQVADASLPMDMEDDCSAHVNANCSDRGHPDPNIAFASSISTSLVTPGSVNNPTIEETAEASGGEMEQVAEASLPINSGDHFSADADANFTGVGSNNGDDALPEETAAEEGETEAKNTDDINISLNSMYSDTFEAAVMDLEELILRVKWLKDILDHPHHTSPRSSWDFVSPRR